MTKLLIEEKDETQLYRPAPIQQILEMVKLDENKIIIYVPNACGGETRITIFESCLPRGNPENITRCQQLRKEDEK